MYYERKILKTFTNTNTKQGFRILPVQYCFLFLFDDLQDGHSSPL